MSAIHTFKKNELKTSKIWFSNPLIPSQGLQWLQPTLAAQGARWVPPWTGGPSIAGPLTPLLTQTGTMETHRLPHWHIFGMWQENGTPVENPHRHGECANSHTQWRWPRIDFLKISVILKRGYQRTYETFLLYFIFIYFYYFVNPHPRICLLILERKEGGERETERETSMWERNINGLPPLHTLTGDWTCSLGMCPEQGLNLQPFGVWDVTPTKHTTQQGQRLCFFFNWWYIITERVSFLTDSFFPVPVQ